MISYHSEENLLVYIPTGTMNLESIQAYYQTVAQYKEEGCTRRFVNLDNLDSIDFGYNDIGAIDYLAQQSRTTPGIPIKIALLANRPISLGIANMVSKLMEKDDYTIQVCASHAEAADFLVVTEDLLQGDE